MAKELERDLGLVSVVAISMGAMIGSGIFVLPGIAMSESGPAVILAFFLAAVLVVPAGLSIAELGTAMPDAGGDYVFIERGMGPAAGTIAGLGTWLMLMFKGALALVGGMFYLDVLFALPSHVAVAIVVGTALIIINLVGVKQTGQLQSIMVVILVVILSAFVIAAITRIEGTQYSPFFTHGFDGLITATTTVLVSYAGVTKVAAVAEEIEDPGRNLPLGLLASLILTAFLYVLIVFVLVGTVEPEQLADSNIPMVDAVDALALPGLFILDEAQLAFVAVFAIVLAAILALVSTANAGILTASRYPLALSRDDLLPELFAYIHPRLRTPVIAILVTGAAMLFIIVALPVEDIAKTAGAFQILVYVLVCTALIAFRERKLEWYDPDFRTPGYPWIQLFGVISGIYIISQMDLLPLAGSVVILVGGYVWYHYYAKDRVDREGIAVDAARRQAGRQFIEQTEQQLDEPDVGDEILIALRGDASRLEENRLLEIAAPIAQTRGSRVRVVRFDEVPDQFPLDQATTVEPDDIEFEERTDELAQKFDVDIEIGEIVSHDTKHAVVNYAERYGVDLILTRSDPVSRLRTLFGRDSDWIMKHAPCDVVFIQSGALESLSEIAIVTDRSPFNDPLKVELADSIASAAGAKIRFVFSVGENPSEQYTETIHDYHDELDNSCYAPVEGEIIEGGDATDRLIETLESADMVMLSTVTHRRLPDLFFIQRPDRVAARLEQPVLFVHSRKTRRATFLEPIIDRILFRS